MSSCGGLSGTSENQTNVPADLADLQNEEAADSAPPSNLESDPTPIPTPDPVVPIPSPDETANVVAPDPNDMGALLLGENVTIMRSATCLTEPVELDVALFDNARSDYGFWEAWNNANVDSSVSAELKTQYSADPYLGNKDVALQMRAYCDNQSTFKINLLRKFGNWQSQHFNGLVFTDGALRASQLSHVLMDIAVDNQLSVLPSEDQVSAVFADTFQTITGQAFVPTDIDNGNYTFRLELADRDAPAEERVLKSSIFIQLDPAEYAEARFARIIVPISQMNWFYEQNYQSTPVTLQELLALNATLSKAIITAETSENALVRGLLDQAVDDPDFSVDANFDALNLPEIFKDQHLELIRIGFIYQ
ncbi:MAG: hypothetical protein P8104_00335 [Gammaproteobacteria bacterium]